MEAAQQAMRFPPAAQRLYQRKLAKSNKNIIMARQAVAHKLARACYDIRRDLVPCAATKAFGCGLRCSRVEARGWGKSWMSTIRSESSWSQPVTEGLPPECGVVRRLCREPEKRWTREGARRSGRWTRLDTAGHRGFSGARSVPGADVWRWSEMSRSLEPDGWLRRRTGSRPHNKENQGASEATHRGNGPNPNATEKSCQKWWKGEVLPLDRSLLMGDFSVA
jgi:hypothetical protein